MEMRNKKAQKMPKIKLLGATLNLERGVAENNKKMKFIDSAKRVQKWTQRVFISIYYIFMSSISN